MSVEFDSPANRIIQQFEPKNKFRIDTNLPDIAFLRQLSIQGRLFFAQANTSATDTTLITRTPVTGSTEFYFKLILNVSSVGRYRFDITNSGNTRIDTDVAATSAEATQTEHISFFDSLVGDGMKTFNISATELSGTGSTRVSLFGWSENTSRIRDAAI